MNPSKIAISKLGARTVLSPKVALTYQNCEELEAVFNECLEQRKSEIIIDCKSVPFFDSEVLGLLVQKHEEFRDRGGILKLTGMNAVCKDILLATRLIDIFHVHEDIHEAIKSGP